MKLGLVIKITNYGIAEALSINKDDNWARFTDDVRPAINVLKNFDGTGKSILLVKFLGNLGYLLALVKSRPEGSGRGGDNTAAWIYIPSKCDITNTQIEAVLQNVETAISASKGIDREILNEIFNTNYNEKDVLFSAVGTIISKKDADYAVRYYGRGCVFVPNELLGSSIAQQEYANYKGIFFIDNKEGIIANCKKLNFEPQTICTIHPPKNTDGFTPCFLQGEKYVPYNKPIEVPTGAKIIIHWIRQGYAPIVKSVVAQDNNSCYRSLEISPNEYSIIIRRDRFRVSSVNGSPISNFDIWINNKQMTGDSMEVSEAAVKQGLHLSVHANGYSEWKKDNVHLNGVEDIRLQRKVYHYEFEIPVCTSDFNAYALVTYETHHRLKESPIEGYSLCNHDIYEGQVNRISYNNGFIYKLKYFALGVVSCLLAILLWAGWQALDNYEFNFGWPPFKEIKQQPQTSEDNIGEKYTEETSDNVDSLNAVTYLNNNSTWHKDSLDKYEKTRGLFDELNEFRQEDIAKSAETLGDVPRLKDIINTFENSPYDHHIGKEANNGNYNKPTDKGISVDNYIEWISTQHTPADINSTPAPNPPTSAATHPKTDNSKITGKTRKQSKPAQTQAKPATGQSSNSGKRGGI